MEIVAFTTDQVRRLTGLSKRQIRYWDETGFFSPTIVDSGRRIFTRIYTFRDVVGLRTIAMLRQKLPLQELRRVGEWLRDRHEAPWSTLNFAIAGKRVAFYDKEIEEYVEASGLGQEVMSVALEPIAHKVNTEAAKMRNRQESEVGKIIRNRYVVHNAWCVAGTRIPIQAIRNFHDAGYSVDAIIREFPRLTPADVEAAITHTHPSASAA
jgi:DNA-binding transcriptional MerR regulator